MPLIAPQRQQHREPLTIRLDVQLVALLKRYTEFIASSMDYVTSQALLMTFSKDADYREWLQGKHPADAKALSELLAQQPRAEHQHRFVRKTNGEPQPARGVTG